jgi:glycosyltransferase involved in cell wall biosynthesis
VSNATRDQPATVDVVIPAFNEERSLPLVLGALPRPPVRRVVVADNASTDDTSRVAREGGAEVVPETRRGYGSACLAGLDHLRRTGPPDIVAFVDADFSDHPEELLSLIAPILAGEADLVIGSRILGSREPGALLPQARMGNFVACRMIRLLYGHRFTDLGPFRAVSWEALERMKIKAVRLGLRCTEVPVSYRRRVGVSKITGTVSGTIRAGYKILWTVLRYSFGGRR